MLNKRGVMMNKLFDRINEKGYVLIAEAGVNYYDIAAQRGISNIEAAKLMCKKAFENGADAIKFQTYKADRIASREALSYWDLSEESATSQYELFKKYDLFDKEDYLELSDYCNDLSGIFFSTPFDFQSADYLEEMMETYKVSASDITNIPFIEHICKKNKPIILSTGAANEEEVRTAVNVIKSYGNKLAILHCVLEYPTPSKHANLKRIQTLKHMFPEEIIGYSDHTKPTNGYDTVKAAYILGAQVIEKHYTLDKSLPGNDHYHAMDSEDIKRIVEEIEKLKVILGEGRIDYLESELGARQNARRSIVANRDIKKGEILAADDLTFKRPGCGISPSRINEVIGIKAVCDIPEDKVITWNMLGE